MQIVLFILFSVGLVLASNVENPSPEGSADSVESLLRKLLVKTEQVKERILALRQDESLQENDYMPDGLKELISEKMEEMPDDEEESDRIFGGQVAPRNGYPHQVGIALQFAMGQSSWCGGSIISDSYVVTAAHCLDSVSSASMMFGAHDRVSSAESGRQNQMVRSSNFIVHRGWNSQNMKNDIALIRLNQKLRFNSQIQPVALPSRQSESFGGQTAIISGWGHYDSSKQLSRYLRHAQSVIVNNSVCSRYFSSYVQNSNVCLDGSRGQGTCNGDSGGPMVVRATNGQAVLIGLTSFGSGQGCDRGWPTVYTRISSFLPWITQNSGIQT